MTLGFRFSVTFDFRFKKELHLDDALFKQHINQGLQSALNPDKGVGNKLKLVDYKITQDQIIVNLKEERLFNQSNAWDIRIFKNGFIGYLSNRVAHLSVKDSDLPGGKEYKERIKVINSIRQQRQEAALGLGIPDKDKWKMTN